MIERFNRTLENQLAMYMEAHQHDWDCHVPYVMIYRSTPTEIDVWERVKAAIDRVIQLMPTVSLI